MPQLCLEITAPYPSQIVLYTQYHQNPLMVPFYKKFYQQIPPKQAMTYRFYFNQESALYLIEGFYWQILIRTEAGEGAQLNGTLVVGHQTYGLYQLSSDLLVIQVEGLTRPQYQYKTYFLNVMNGAAAAAASFEIVAKLSQHRLQYVNTHPNSRDEQKDRSGGILSVLEKVLDNIFLIILSVFVIAAVCVYLTLRYRKIRQRPQH